MWIGQLCSAGWGGRPDEEVRVGPSVAGGQRLLLSGYGVEVWPLVIVCEWVCLVVVVVCGVGIALLWGVWHAYMRKVWDIGSEVLCSSKVSCSCAVGRMVRCVVSVSVCIDEGVCFEGCNGETVREHLCGIGGVTYHGSFLWGPG